MEVFLMLFMAFISHALVYQCGKLVATLHFKQFMEGLDAPTDTAEGR